MMTVLRLDGFGATIFAVLISSLMSCTTNSDSTVLTKQFDGKVQTPQTDGDAVDRYSEAREMMVSTQLAGRGIVNERILDAMQTVSRHNFVPTSQQRNAYDDSPLPIGHDQTISQPYIVALMTQLVDPKSGHKALDVGTGSGYQAAILAELVKNVFSIEIIKSLADDADARLRAMGYENIVVRHGDGYTGWPLEAPFDVIIVAAAPDHIPQALVDQLAPGGKLVIPVGEHYQKLLVVDKRQDGTVSQRNIAPVRFVPMTGQAAE